ncbi:MAG: hypothetical protein ACE15F_23270 [bacterium]
MPDDSGWPRVFQKGGQAVVIYQPQVEEWDNYTRIHIKAAAAVALQKDQEPFFGVLSLKASTYTDHDARTVLIKEPERDIRFPNLDTEKSAQCKALVLEVLPNRQSITVALDRLMAYMDDTENLQKETEVNLDPPQLFYSDRAAILVIFLGEPKFKPIPGSRLMFAINTNWDVIFDTQGSQYYLLNGESWLTTSDLAKGKWTAVKRLPAEFSKIPDEENYAEVRKQIPGRSVQDLPAVFVSYEPAELIQTVGEPQYSPISGTQLMYVTNTECSLIVDNQKQQFYFLTAGRWFRAPALIGPWTASTFDLPEDFSKIPADHPLSQVRVSIPGTVEADDAVLLASVPRTATVKKSEAQAKVVYQGEPEFREIQGTGVQYAVNTPTDVFQAEGQFYCCYDGVWFVSVKPEGPWVVCTSVPEEIYAIPASHPKHNVTYVYVYDSTPDTVVTGYTSGYTGEYVMGGLLLFGAGMALGAALADDDCDYCYSWHYHSCFYSYGCGYAYNYRYGGYYGGYAAGFRAYGPYGGAGGMAYYNPATGRYGRGGYAYGPGGAVYGREMYNPDTNTYAGRAGGSNIYGSWSRGVVARGDDWIRGGQASTARGSAGWVETSRGGKAIGVDTRRADGYVIKDQNGNIYVGNDDNIYRKDENGDWQKRNGNQWEDTGFDGSKRDAASTNARNTASPKENRLSKDTAPSTSRVGKTSQDKLTSKESNATPVRDRQPSTTRQPAAARQPSATRQPAVSRPSSTASTDLPSRLESDSFARDRGNQSFERFKQSSSAGASDRPSGGHGNRAAGGGARRVGRPR